MASILAHQYGADFRHHLDIWQWTPLITLIALAGLKRVPPDQLEATMVDGVPPLRPFP